MPDLTDAVDAASVALHWDNCTEGGPHGVCDRFDWTREAEVALDAALPHIEKQIRRQVAAEIEACVWEVASGHQFHTTTCTCGFYSPVARQRTEHILAELRAARHRLHPEGDTSCMT